MSDLMQDPDLNRLVHELNRGSAPEPDEEPTGEPAREAATRPFPLPLMARTAEVEVAGELARLLSTLAGQGGSDLLLVAGRPPVLRRNGSLGELPEAAVRAEGLRSLFERHLDEHCRRALAEQGSADFSLRLRDPAGGRAVWRFRVNLHRQRGELAAAVRALPREIPTLEGLNLPAQLADLVRTDSGLVLLCGPTGAGKTTTLAALVREIYLQRSCHIITIEDPVEYEHSTGRAVIEHIEVGRDAPSFAAALRSALRQDPDVLLVGEMRDLETIRTALTAAETGHLVLSTLHTGSVVRSVHRVVDVFPAEQQAQVRVQLAQALRAVVAQHLLPRAAGNGRVPAVEILHATYAVRHLIRGQHPEKLYNELTLGRRDGMRSLEASLAEWIRSGVVEREEALLRANHPDELNSLLARRHGHLPAP